METSTIGLTVLVAAWLIQMICALKGRKDVQNSFLVVYAVGGLILVLDGFTGVGFTVRAWQNLVIVFFIAVILVKNFVK